MPESRNLYTLNKVKDPSGWGARENTLLRAIVDLLPPAGSVNVNAEHKHRNVWNAGGTDIIISVDGSDAIELGNATKAGKLLFRDGIDVVNDIALFTDSTASFVFDTGATVTGRNGFITKEGDGGWQFVSGAAPVAQGVYPFEFKINGPGLGTTHLDTFAFQVTDSDDCLLAFNTDVAEKFVLGYQDDDKFLLNKTSTVSAANQVMLYDPDGHEAGDGEFLFGGVNTNVTSIKIEQNGTDVNTRLILLRTSAIAAGPVNFADIIFQAPDDGGNLTTYVEIAGYAKDPTNGSEKGRLDFRIRGTGLTNVILIDEEGLKIGATATSTIHCYADNAAPASTTLGALWLDLDAGANGTLKIFANGSYRTVQVL